MEDKSGEYLLNQLTASSFTLLNHGWNAEPNAPYPVIGVDGADLLLAFYLNAFIFPQFQEGDAGLLRFKNVTRYRLGATNDEGWYRGQCRYSGVAPKWGEFYEISDHTPLANEPRDWVVVHQSGANDRHFLFYLRDATFECNAESWSFTHVQQCVPDDVLAAAGVSIAED